MNHTPTPSDGIATPQRYWAIAAIALGMLVAILDSSITNIALPTMAHDLHISPNASVWIINGYQLAITVSLLTLAALGNRWGCRKVYLVGLLLFTLNSLGCALARSMDALITARVLQGLGAACIISVNTALVRIIYPAKELSRGMGINSLVIATAAAAGPTLASLILSVASWPWLFAVNIPIGVVACLIGYKALPPNNTAPPKGRFDTWGALLSAATMGLLIVVIDSFSHEVRRSTVLLELLLLGVLTGVLLYQQRRVKEPLVPLDLLRIKAIRHAQLATFFSYAAQMLALVSLPFFIQERMGLSAVHTGLLLTPWPLSTMLFAPISGRLATRMAPQHVACGGALLFAVGLLWLALMPERVHLGLLMGGMVIAGAGFGLFQTPNNSLLMAAAPASRSASASGLLGTVRILGQTCGTAIVALLFLVSPQQSNLWALALASGCAALGALAEGSLPTSGMPYAGGGGVLSAEPIFHDTQKDGQ